MGQVTTETFDNGVKKITVVALTHAELQVPLVLGRFGLDKWKRYDNARVGRNICFVFSYMKTKIENVLVCSGARFSKVPVT